MRIVAAIVGVLLPALAACSPSTPESTMKPNPKIECADCVSEPVPESSLPKSEEEWKKRLTAEQFRVLRRGGTETPNTGPYLHHTGDGIYACAGCGQPLYDSKTKYDACGWPSYWEAIPGAVGTRNDGGSVEAICSRCQGHLGHIFDDGPAPTGKRH